MAREMHKYYFYHWDESTGDKLDHWGTSDWYFEVGEDEYVLKVIQVFASGNALFYSETHIEDEYGFLSEGKFELIGEEKEISKAEFEKILNNTKFTNVVGAI